MCICICICDCKRIRTTDRAIQTALQLPENFDVPFTYFRSFAAFFLLLNSTGNFLLFVGWKYYLWKDWEWKTLIWDNSFPLFLDRGELFFRNDNPFLKILSPRNGDINLQLSAPFTFQHQCQKCHTMTMTMTMTMTHNDWLTH